MKTVGPVTVTIDRHDINVVLFALGERLKAARVELDTIFDSLERPLEYHEKFLLPTVLRNLSAEEVSEQYHTWKTLVMTIENLMEMFAKAKQGE